MRPIVSFNEHGHMLDPQFHKCQEFMTFRLQVDRSPQKQLIFGAFLAHMTFHSGRTSAGLWPASARARLTFHFGRCAGAALFFAILLSMLRLALVRAKARPSACPRICLRKRGARVLPSAALFFAFRGCCPLLCILTQYAQARARAG